MIKLLDISEAKLKKIEDWLSLELTAALRDRGELEERWQRWNAQFEAKPEREIKNFPFEKSSNLVIPMQGITVNAMVARHINTIYGQRPLWTATALSPKWTDHALPSQKLLDYAQKFEMKMPIQMVPWLYDVGNMGTGFVKVPWLIDSRRQKTYDPKGEIIAYEQEVANGPRFIPVSPEDMILPTQSIQDIQEAPWIAHRFRLRWPTIETREKRKAYINTKRIKNFFTDRANLITEEKERNEHLSRSELVEEYELYEVWAFHDYDECGWEESCVFTYHLDSSTVIRPTLNPFQHGWRPFISQQCFPRPHRVYGIGFGQKLERLQEGISTTVNQAIDNASIANARCLKARRGKGIKPGVKIYPGKVFLLDELTDLDSFQLGDIYPSSNLIINFLRDFVERDTGVSDYSLGKESSIVGSAATATSTLALIQEGTKLFDFLLKSIRNSLAEVAYQVHSLYSQFRPAGLVYPLLGEKDAGLVEETWQAPEGDVRKGLLFELTASSAYVNQALERESWVQLFNLILGYYSKMFEAAEVILNPQVPPQMRVLAGRMAASGQLIIQRILGHWNILDADRLLINIEDLVAGLGGENTFGAMPMTPQGLKQMAMGQLPGGPGAPPPQPAQSQQGAQPIPFRGRRR